jgi:hypothetical protein
MNYESKIPSSTIIPFTTIVERERERDASCYGAYCTYKEK